MLLVVLIIAAILALAALSATAAYRFAGSEAWRREYGANGQGLAIELVFLLLTVCATGAVASIMHASFARLFLEGGWTSPWYLGASGVAFVGVCVYMLIVAPKILAGTQNVPAERVGRECRLPYLAYLPFSLVTWVGLALPLAAVMIVSVPADRAALGESRVEMEAQGVVLVESVHTDKAEARLELYTLTHRDVTERLQRMVSRYLWVVGVFMVFMVVILNTDITTIFTDTAVDAFKWLMWGLLAVSVGICLLGLERYQMFRELADGAVAQTLALAESAGRLELSAAVKTALLDVRDAGSVRFLVMVFEGGGLWLLFFSYAIQIVMAKITDRSVVRVVFPRPVAAFLDEFIVSSEDAKP